MSGSMFSGATVIDMPRCCMPPLSRFAFHAVLFELFLNECRRLANHCSFGTPANSSPAASTPVPVTTAAPSEVLTAAPTKAAPTNAATAGTATVGQSNRPEITYVVSAAVGQAVEMPESAQELNTSLLGYKNHCTSHLPTSCVSGASNELSVW